MKQLVKNSPKQRSHEYDKEKREERKKDKDKRNAQRNRRDVFNDDEVILFNPPTIRPVIPTLQGVLLLPYLTYLFPLNSPPAPLYRYT